MCSDQCSVLVIEDQWFVAMDVVDSVERAGARPVGPVARVADAMLLIERVPIHLGLADVNLEGEYSFPAVDALLSRGASVILMTGYASSSIPDRYGGLPLIRKPYRHGELVETLRFACAEALRKFPD